MQGQTPESEIDQFAPLDEFSDNEPEAPAETEPDPEMVAWLEDPLGVADEDTFDVEMYQVSTIDEPCSESDADSVLAIEDFDPTPTTDEPIVVDGERLETSDDILSPDEFEQLVALSQSPPEDDAVPDASEEVEPVATQVEQKIDFLPVLNEIRDLRDGLASYQGLEHSLVELSQNSEAMGNTTLDQLEVLLDEVAALRQETEITRDATLVFTNTIRELVTTVASHKLRTGHSRRGTPGKLGLVTLIIAMLLCIATIGWAVRGYQQSGELHYAVIGLLVVNLIGGGTVLWNRRN